MDSAPPILKTKSKLPIIIGAVVLAAVILFGRWLTGKIMPTPLAPVTKEEIQNLGASSSPEVNRRQPALEPQSPAGDLYQNNSGIGTFDFSTVPQVQSEWPMDMSYEQLMEGGLENLTPEQQALMKQYQNPNSFGNQQMMEELLKAISSSSKPQL
ncbi:MAG: hypothetical protein HY813_01505 [Candidatus Portnoybacteria bacterium]|nr:hypothetical protein [Candidatus Portnoybacteria bacterium]